MVGWLAVHVDVGGGGSGSGGGGMVSQGRGEGHVPHAMPSSPTSSLPDGDSNEGSHSLRHAGIIDSVNVHYI